MLGSAGVDGRNENDELDIRGNRLLHEVARTVIVDYLGVVVALRAAADSDDHGAGADHRVCQSLNAANVSDELRYLRWKNPRASGGISHQGANENAAFE